MVAFFIVVPVAAGGAAGSSFSGGLEPAESHPRIAIGSRVRRSFDMWVLLLEAFGAVLLLGLIVWWTMFHGRRGGERERDR